MKKVFEGEDRTEQYDKWVKDNPQYQVVGYEVHNGKITAVYTEKGEVIEDES